MFTPTSIDLVVRTGQQQFEREAQVSRLLEAQDGSESRVRSALRRLDEGYRSRPASRGDGMESRDVADPQRTVRPQLSTEV